MPLRFFDAAAPAGANGSRLRQVVAKALPPDAAPQALPMLAPGLCVLRMATAAGSSTQRVVRN